MDIEKKKALINEYKSRKTQMGILKIKCSKSKNIYFKAASDISVAENSLIARLSSNMYRGSRNAEIQKDWNDFGKDSFSFEIADILEQRENESKEDCENELSVLLSLWLTKTENSKEVL